MLCERVITPIVASEDEERMREITVQDMKVFPRGFPRPALEKRTMLLLHHGSKPMRPMLGT